MTSVGNDGFPSVMKALKSNSERSIRVIGVDVRSDAAGLYLADQGYLVPSRVFSDELVQTLLRIGQQENVQFLYPLSTDDQEFFACRAEGFERAGIFVMVSPMEALQIANDKTKLYDFARSNGIPTPRYELARNWGEFQDGVRRLGYPQYPVVLKMNRGTGAQGLKIIYADIDPQRRLLDRENRVVTFHEVEYWLKSIENWPPLHLVEHLPGDEYSVDILCDHGRVVSAITRLRLLTHYGMALHAKVVKEATVEKLACELVAKLGLRFVVNVQIRFDRNGKAMLMEVNPRIPGTIGLTVAAGVNMPYLALKMVLNEVLKVSEPRLGTTILRHWDAIYLTEEKKL
jgi:carbamoyl-phosphate synthase large subunit